MGKLVSVLQCVLTEDMAAADTVPGTEVEHCEACAAEIWLSPNGKDLHAQGFVLHCTRCFRERLDQGKEEDPRVWLLDENDMTDQEAGQMRRRRNAPFN